jgi:biopolymer transport protein ExbB/TolQ
MKQVIERIVSPTPKFFKKLRNIGLVFAGISTAIITAPIALPAAIVSIAGYVGLASGVLSAVSQVAKEGE